MITDRLHREEHLDLPLPAKLVAAHRMPDGIPQLTGYGWQFKTELPRLTIVPRLVEVVAQTYAEFMRIEVFELDRIGLGSNGRMTGASLTQ